MLSKPRDNISETAANMALIRSLESAKAPRPRLFADPLARRFLPGWQRALMLPARIPVWRQIMENLFDRQAPGARTSGSARTRLIDDWTRVAVCNGAAQVVITGAGFDCRALRMPELMTCAVFELDRGEMHDLKSRLLADTQAPWVRRVPIDFLSEKPEDCLVAAGYSQALKTLFIWEGVTNYLYADAVDAVFDLFGRSAPQSSVIFTYVHIDAINGSFPAPGLAQLLERLRRIGEAWTFGFRPEDVPDYLARKGFRLIADLGATEYRALYWPQPERLEGYEFYHAVLAEKVDAARQT
jgi:methyltransferase (TIGR00027 family)